MGDIKSAFERAWERAEKIEVTQDKVRELEYQPEGARMAALFLKEEGYDLEKALDESPAEKRPHLRAGAEATFLSNITLPRNSRSRREMERAMAGLQLLKKDKSRLSHVAARIDGFFAAYERTRQSLFEQLKREVEEAVRRAMQQRGLPPPVRLDVEQLPEFQQRWHEHQTKLHWEYEGRLAELKTELSRVR